MSPGDAAVWALIVAGVLLRVALMKWNLACLVGRHHWRVTGLAPYPTRPCAWRCRKCGKKRAVAA